MHSPSAKSSTKIPRPGVLRSQGARGARIEPADCTFDRIFGHFRLAGAPPARPRRRRRAPAPAPPGRAPRHVCAPASTLGVRILRPLAPPSRSFALQPAHSSSASSRAPPRSVPARRTRTTRLHARVSLRPQTAGDRKHGRMCSRRARNRAREFCDQAFCAAKAREGRKSTRRLHIRPRFRSFLISPPLHLPASAPYTPGLPTRHVCAPARPSRSAHPSTPHPPAPPAPRTPHPAPPRDPAHPCAAVPAFAVCNAHQATRNYPYVLGRRCAPPWPFNNPTAWAICVYVATGCIRVGINSPGLYLKSPSSMIDINEILNMQQGRGYVYLFP